MTKTLFDRSVDGIRVRQLVCVGDNETLCPQMHEEYEIYYQNTGNNLFFLEGHTYQITGGDLLFINRNEIHKAGALSGFTGEVFSIHLEDEFFSLYPNGLPGFSFTDFFERNEGKLSLCKTDRASVEILFSDLEKEMSCPGSESREMVIGKLITLMLYKAKYKVTDNRNIDYLLHPSYKKVDNVADYIAHNYRFDISLDCLSLDFYVNKSYLCRIFKKTTGYSVTEYTNAKRIQKSLSLLRNTGMNISRIAKECGFESTSSFDRAFRKYKGTTPLKYRNSLCANSQRELKSVTSSSILT